MMPVKTVARRPAAPLVPSPQITPSQLIALAPFKIPGQALVLFEQAHLQCRAGSGQGSTGRKGVLRERTTSRERGASDHVA